jgi:hypothetical protein
MLFLTDLVRRSNDELAAIDTAQVHLACAAGLAHPATIDERGTLGKVCDYARLVTEYTEANLPRWRERPQDCPQHHHEAGFRIQCMADVFTEKLGLRFDPDAFDDKLYPAIGKTFLFGLTATKRYTHATFPVLWAAVGRRLGYPIKLVSGRWRSGKPHLFPRWEERGGVCLNIEINQRGLQCPSMDHYCDSGNFFVPADEAKRCRLLRSKTPRQELAHFLVQRGQWWLDQKQTRFAVWAFAWASALFPENVAYAEQLIGLLRAWHDALERRKPPRWPDIAVESRSRRFAEPLPLEVERDVLLLEATENLLVMPEFDQRFWEPLRHGSPVRLPSRITAVYQEETFSLRFEDKPRHEFACPPITPLLRYPCWSPPPLPPTPPSPVVVPALASGLTRSTTGGRRLHWRDLVEKPDEEYELAAKHFACMADLPDAADVDIDRCLDQIIVLTRSVEEFIEQRLKRFRQLPNRLDHSEARFRMLSMVTHLQRDWGLLYNRPKAQPGATLYTADRFLHGLLFGDGGTCASIPVLYAAIGRRLGYPIKLVAAMSVRGIHTFARWEGADGECFNIEATNIGLSCPPDYAYRTEDYALTPELEQAGQFLISQTPRMELAWFMMDRGYSWKGLGRTREALESFAWSMALTPENHALYSFLAVTAMQWQKEQEERIPRGFPMLQLYHALRWPEVLPQRSQSCILMGEVTDALLNDKWCEENWWGPLRRGEKVEVPTVAHARFDRAGCAEIEFEFS